MKFAETELRQIAEDTWRIVLGEELEPRAQAIAPAEIDDCIAGTAQITGDWQLALVIYGPAAVARRVATVMFSLDNEPPMVEDVQDAMGELVNILAGNVKGVLSGSSHLCFPKLVSGQDLKPMFPRHVRLSEIAFTYIGEPVVVMLLGEDKLATRLEQRYESAPDASS